MRKRKTYLNIINCMRMRPKNYLLLPTVGVKDDHANVATITGKDENVRIVLASSAPVATVEDLSLGVVGGQCLKATLDVFSRLQIVKCKEEVLLSP